DLAKGDKQEFEGIQHFAFSGEAAGWLALHRHSADSAARPAEGAGRPGEPPSRPADGAKKPEKKAQGSDLILRELANGNELTTGNVSEFAFDKKGRWLALAIDAQGQIGNGVQLFDLSTSTLRPLDSGRANYKHLNWTEKGDGLAVLKGVEDKAYEDDR